MFTPPPENERKTPMIPHVVVAGERLADLEEHRLLLPDLRVRLLEALFLLPASRITSRHPTPFFA